MLRVGLTGGLACGKSTVAKMMEARGARVIQADGIAHELMRPGEAIYAEVVKHFGPEIVNPDGQINRAKLAQSAFGDGRVEELNRIVHPAVIARQQQWMAEVASLEPNAIAVVEAALILEAGVNGRFDKIVVVTCTPQQKIDRFVRRVVASGRGSLEADAAVAEKEAEKRIAAQLSDEDKIKVADFVIDNSGSLEHTEEQVSKVMQELQAMVVQQSL